MKVITIVGTRPEIIRLSRVMAALDKYFDHKIVHTGQNYDYELNQVFFDDLGVTKPAYFLNAAVGTAAETVGAIIARVDKVLAEEKPDAVLILGDTNSCLAAYPAKRLKIGLPYEAGNRCFDRAFRKKSTAASSTISAASTCRTNHLARISAPRSMPPERILRRAVRCSKF